MNGVARPLFTDPDRKAGRKKRKYCRSSTSILVGKYLHTTPLSRRPSRVTCLYTQEFPSAHPTLLWRAARQKRRISNANVMYKVWFIVPRCPRKVKQLLRF